MINDTNEYYYIVEDNKNGILQKSIYGNYYAQIIF